ncbi:MAG: ferritin-like domain-containing protein [Phycisphaerae bacterium]
MKLDSLKKLYVHELKDLYSAENQILAALPSMASAAKDAGLQKAFKDHQAETKQHVLRLEQIFKSLEFQPGGHHCKGMEGLLAEGKDMLKSDIDDDVRDAGLIAAAQRVEHYEIAGYGVARTYAEKLGDFEAADLLQETLNEEGATDQKLSRLAERRINFMARVS